MIPLRFKEEPLSQDFIRLIDVFFGVLIAQTLVIYKDIILNLSFKILLLIAVYVVVFYSWYGYHQSVRKYPYNKTISSRIRLIFDLFIVFSYAILIISIQNGKSLLLIMSFIFILYFLTGLCRIIEWQDSKVSIWYLSVIFASIFFILFLIYPENPENSYFQIIPPILIIILTLLYRQKRSCLGYPPLIVIGVDIDGVLGDQVNPILSRLKEEGIKIEKNKEDIKRWNEPLTDELNIETEIEQALLDPDYILEMPVIHNSIKIMARLYKKYHIVIASSRPEITVESTVCWLKKHFVYHEYINTRKIGKTRIGLDILIDDNPTNIIDFIKTTNKKAIVFTQPWNENNDKIKKLIKTGKCIKCNNWKEIPSLIKKNFNEEWSC